MKHSSNTARVCLMLSLPLLAACAKKDDNAATTDTMAASTTPHDLRLMIEQHTMELAAEQAAAGQ